MLFTPWPRSEDRHSRPRSVGRQVWRSLGSLLVLPALWGTIPGGWAQVADVARPDAQGDFTAITFPGARGLVLQRFWLVVDRDPRGLWCRDVRGRALVALRQGAVVETADRGADARAAPLFSQGKPFLRVRFKPVDILYDARLSAQGSGSTCLVRVNTAFLAPIHLDSMEQALQN